VLERHFLDPPVCFDRQNQILIVQELPGLRGATRAESVRVLSAVVIAERIFSDPARFDTIIRSRNVSAGTAAEEG
jgi:hypothetical protein